jgi:hypothetical protein
MGSWGMKIMADDEKLLVEDTKGHLKLISLTDGEVIKDYGRVHGHEITVIMITEDQKFFFTSSVGGVLKQWNYEDNTFVKDHAKITSNYISSLCL